MSASTSARRSVWVRWAHLGAAVALAAGGCAWLLSRLEPAQAAPAAAGKLARPLAASVAAASVADEPFTSVFLALETEHTHMAWGDYDLDGDLDLATAGSPSRLYRNDGVQDGVPILTLQSWNPGGIANALAWGDYDRDGDLDLAVGKGDRTFSTGQANNIYRNTSGVLASSAAWTSAEIEVTTSLAWGDVDGDGDLDLAVGNTAAPTRVYRNNGGADPTFTLLFSSASNDARGVAWADYDDDNDLDLAVASWNLPNRLYPNTGTTLSATSVWTPTTTYQATSVSWGDVDRDGDPDLAVARYGGPNYIYLNTGTALAVAPAWSSPESDTTSSFLWGDYDGDGDLDLAAGNVNEALRLYRNDTPQNGVPQVSLAWTSSLLDGMGNIGWGDFDDDGDLDLAAGSSIGSFRLYRNNYNTLRTTNSWLTPPIAQTKDVAWGDYDGDGDIDLAVANSNQLPQLYRNNAGTLVNTTVWTPTTALVDATSVAWGDYDGDGDLDLAVGVYGARSQLYRNNAGALSATTVWTPTSVYNTNSVAWGDYDNDGDLDLALGNYAQPLRVFRNTAGTLETTPAFSSGTSNDSNSLAWGDVDNDGDLDLATGNGGNFGQVNRLYLNVGGVLSSTAAWTSAESDGTNAIAWGDYDNDGDLDLAAGNYANATRLYRNDDGRLTTQSVWNSVEADVVSSLAWGDFDGDGDLDLAAATRGTRSNRVYRNEGGTLTPQAIWSSQELDDSFSIAWGDVDNDGDLDLAVGNYNDPNRVYLNSRDNRSNAGAIPAVRVRRPGIQGDFYSLPAVRSGLTAIPFRLSDPQFNPVREIRAYFSPNGGGQWYPAVAATGTLTTNLSTFTFVPPFTFRPYRDYNFTWDVNASGFFGQSDNVVFRIEAVPAVVTTTTDTTPGPYLFGSFASQSFPFRVRGTQVRVISGTTPVANAIVFRLPAGQTLGGALIRSDAGVPFSTDAQGYLQGRGTLNPGDRLLALTPITGTSVYTVYATNGTATPIGVDAFTVGAGGVQVITTTAAKPLVLFNLDLSLEWDASNDPAYLEELSANLQSASEYLYNFTDGQAALGQVNVFQNADEWAYAHVVVQANNRLRPFALQGGLVVTPTVDPQHAEIVYSPGQVTMGATWNRYGRPGQNLGDDWALILAHELSHYLFYEDDVYLGLDASGQLIPVDTCTGSAMGDIYDLPDSWNFIFQDAHWNSACQNTLANRTLGRDEWQTLRLWYPWLSEPGAVLAGPTGMPFDFTDITLHPPYTPTNPLADPTFYIDYVGGGVSSSEARAFLLRDNQFAINLGAPFGGQNRVIAYGARAGDRLCVFDRAFDEYGCEDLTAGDNRVQMERDETWAPFLQFQPVNSTTLGISVTAVPAGLSLMARLYPDLGPGTSPLALTPSGSAYAATFNLANPAMAGNLQLWVNEAATETDPRRETMVAFSIGGNPGAFRAGGGAFRAGGGAFRAGGGAFRAGGGAFRAGGAPILSPDGQMIFFTENPLDFAEGTFFAIQGMAGLPAIPPGRTVVGQGYNLVASPGASLPPGSITVQYLPNDVLVANATESDLTLYFWNGSAWTALDTLRAPDINLVSAPSQGPGVYALMASVQIPLAQVGWNAVGYPVRATRPVSTALESIDGKYTLVYSYVATDTVDPWKLYAVGSVPGFVNDLQTLSFGNGYWIYATVTTTLYLAPGADAGLAAGNLAPPATVYGTLAAGEGFTPAPGQTLTAWIDGIQCGQALTQVYANQIVYAIAVEAAFPGTATCGRPGKTITFRVDGRTMAPIASWDHTRLTELGLAPAASIVYLPLIHR